MTVGHTKTYKSTHSRFRALKEILYKNPPPPSDSPLWILILMNRGRVQGSEVGVGGVWWLSSPAFDTQAQHLWCQNFFGLAAGSAWCGNIGSVFQKGGAVIGTVKGCEPTWWDHG